MNIDPRTTMAGLPIMRVRDALRRVDSYGEWYGDALREALKTTHARLRQLLIVLENDAYIERATQQKDTWRCTLRGTALTLAHATKPVRRTTAGRRLQEFLQRVDAV